MAYNPTIKYDMNIFVFTTAIYRFEVPEPNLVGHLFWPDFRLEILVGWSMEDGLIFFVHVMLLFLNKWGILTFFLNTTKTCVFTENK